MPRDPEQSFDLVLAVIACAALLLFTVADFKQAGIQHAQSSVARIVR
jgi:hypothetical protein